MWAPLLILLYVVIGLTCRSVARGIAIALPFTLLIVGYESIHLHVI